MRHKISMIALGVALLAGCSGGKYDKLADAAPADRTAAEALWAEFQKQLGDPGMGKDPLLVARFFSRDVLTQSVEAEFGKRIAGALKRRTTGLFDSVKVRAVKNGASGLLLVIESKAGEAAIPVVREGERMKFSELAAATGDWKAEAKPVAAVAASSEPSLLYVNMLLRDENAPIGERLKAAVGLAAGKHRNEIVSCQKTVRNPLVRLGLGLARIKLDGSDESFLRNFPTDAAGLSALAQADRAIFEEMISKLGNLGAMVEEPPANEVLYRVASGAPPEMNEIIGRALYNMAELSPGRLANAVKNISKDPASDPVLAIYLEEVKRREGKAPQMLGFLKKFAVSGEPEERQICQAILTRFGKVR